MSDDNLIWQLEQVEQQAVVTLNGILNRETVPQLWQQRQQFSLKANADLQSCQQLVWDLQQISHIDSAGFALLTELLLLNPAEKVRLINLPEQCKNLAALFSLDQWLHHYLINK
ncbi:STAS domain-containing protein [Gallibacterium anatis]|uniref:Predicted NTP binding protein (Contains STAS domain) n=3 Tax=Gallibacterium anatis TaxID=750 RepID=A0A0A3AE38_9PAST|nr:STAS domain-containing protein [Gallibacterium anatis]ERF78758.1 hypothetical protein N561_04490 [Gallibacterium anatis 12656/12]KGQ41287.1 anti-anti-sigma factor [Gallibacterium anatis]KGQ42703.1 anti-anti-sigma factor [Gallibacterium anatis]KGQ51326.1 anti-anti-sigma factor [Gallibacterium anatis]KGQ56061.1 anti-anti-sigma factor [Gallibacterium anatis DSM 16844 = F 149]